MSSMSYWPSLVYGLLLHVVLFFLKLAKCYKLSSLLVKFKVLVWEPNRQRPCGKPNVLPPNLVVSVSSALWTGRLCFHSAPGWPPSP